MGKLRLRSGINLLIFCSACAAMFADYMNWEMLYRILKPLTTVLVISLLFFANNSSLIKFKNIMVAALIFCLLGDILLLQDEFFVFGLGAFLIAHLLLTYGFVVLEGFQFHWISGLFFLVLGLSIFFWLKPDLGNLELPVTIYIFVISLMAWQGIGLWLKKRIIAYAFIAIAVSLFMFSDMMIAVNKFKSPFPLAGVVILSTYWMSIALIANATFLKLKGQDK
ncbi:lysoplasmalogenase [Flagellimonas algicola]|uniref:Lysoplasmalogenase n=1 Tax=Flagellimonas algicola TaxID=2583815 RepID=A0ABY2WK89_9FLAO|nr:lysoplasmalogenase [Allomuricauda algicola]TMU55244.1 lysoplasmalogenase [Allomuricauda algicola]